MKKRIIAIILIIMIVLPTNVFAYRWEEVNGHWYVLNESTGERLKSTLLDTNNNVYYLDESGKLKTGWFLNKKSKKYYFFDNNKKRSLGAMVFGLHMVDGYYYYFGADGSLQTANAKGEFKKVFQDYYADVDGYLYQNNKLMRDTSIIKSEYYTNPLYYENVNLNNYYLANYDTGSIAKRETVERGSGESGEIITSGATNANQKTADAHKTTGGTDYYTDEWGNARGIEVQFETREAEKYGPMLGY